MVRRAIAAAVRRVDRYLDRTFLAGMEVSALTLPTLWFLLFAEPPEAASLSALTAVCASPPTIAACRGGYVGTASWPSPGHFGTMPARSAYYSLVVGAATYLGVVAQLRWESFVLGMAVPAAVCAAVLPAFPRALGALSRVSRASL